MTTNLGEDTASNQISIFPTKSGTVSLDTPYPHGVFKGFIIGAAGAGGVVTYKNPAGETQVAAAPLVGVWYLHPGIEILSSGTTATDLYWLGGE